MTIPEPMPEPGGPAWKMSDSQRRWYTTVTLTLWTLAGVLEALSVMAGADRWLWPWALLTVPTGWVLRDLTREAPRG